MTDTPGTGAPVREAIEKALAEVAGACDCGECADNLLDALNDAGYEVVASKENPND